MLSQILDNACPQDLSSTIFQIKIYKNIMLNFLIFNIKKRRNKKTGKNKYFFQN